MDFDRQMDELKRRAQSRQARHEKVRKSGARYTLVVHNARIKLGLSINEYCLADSIHKLSSHLSPVPGWCIMSKQKLGDTLGFSRQSIHNMLNSLKKKGLIELHSETNHIRTTKLWYETVEVYKTEVFGNK